MQTRLIEEKVVRNGWIQNTWWVRPRWFADGLVVLGEKWEKGSYTLLGPWKNIWLFAKIRALQEEWDGGEAHLNGAEGNIPNMISSWKPETGIQKNSPGWRYQSDICIHEDELTKGMSEPWAILRTRGGKDKLIKATWVGEVEGGDALEVRECRTLFSCLFEGQSIDLESMLSLTWAPICPGVTGPMRKWDRRLSHRRDKISVGCFCLFDCFGGLFGWFGLLCFVGKNKEMGQ